MRFYGVRGGGGWAPSVPPSETRCRAPPAQDQATRRRLSDPTTRRPYPHELFGPPKRAACGGPRRPRAPCTRRACGGAHRGPIRALDGVVAWFGSTGVRDGARRGAPCERVWFTTRPVFSRRLTREEPCSVDLFRRPASVLAVGEYFAAKQPCWTDRTEQPLPRLCAMLTRLMASVSTRSRSYAP